MTDELVADGVTKTYGETTALDGVSLSVAAGEVVALVGPNGAGKTTLVRTLTGTTTPDSGEVRVRGEPPADLDRSTLGVLPQSFSPPRRLTARELLAYYAGLYDDARDPDETLADVGLADAADTWYENCSGGQQRRAVLGAALVNDPELLFLDEPTTGIDPAGRRTVWSLVEDLADRGTTVVLTTHDMAEVERLADRVGLLADGELVAMDDPDAVVAAHGGSTRLVVDVAEPAAVDALAGHRVEHRDGDLVVHDVAPADIGDVVAALETRGVAYRSLEWTQPSLEDAYLALADRAYDPAAERVGAGRAAATDGGRSTGSDGGGGGRSTGSGGGGR